MWPLIEREILPFVEKPARYTGGEFNSTVKSHDGKTSVALIYPDAYEIGISNIGLKILYDIANRERDIVCERAYAPWPDMEKLLREKGVPLYGLESKTPLGSFDVLGFSFQYELLYTNFLNMLDLSGIPLYAKDRAAAHPVVIAGGPAAVNPEPVAPFLDAVVVGDGEDVIVPLVRWIGKMRRAGSNRAEILKKLAGLPGVYVPALYSETQTANGIVPSGKPVKRAVVCDMEKAPFAVRQILPNIQAVQDRAVVEAARGCTRGCRFCQAGMTYRPVRERSAASVLKIAREAVRATGYHEMSLISLSISDYSALPELIGALDRQFAPHGVSFSLPSLRLDSFTLDLAKKVREVRKSGLTFAVEGGTDAIRAVINKNVTEEELFRVARIARDLGWKSLKLYFMVGLPDTTLREEIEGIAGLCEKITAEFRGMAVTASIAVFIPKPHTPYEREAQLPYHESKTAFADILARLKRFRRVNIRFNSPELSRLEGVFSRGDRSLAPAVAAAFRKGARFDGWNDRLDTALWDEAFAECGIRPEKFLEARSPTGPLPWGTIMTGADADYLAGERARSALGKPTPDCSSSLNACANQCGNCDFDETRPLLAKRMKGGKIRISRSFLKNLRVGVLPGYVTRFVYTKTAAAKYINPIDLEEALSRAMIRAGIPAVFTRGFNPHIRVEMGWALPIGFESVYETAEIDLARRMSGRKFRKLLNRSLPEGIRILEAKCWKMPRRKLSKTAKAHDTTFQIQCGLAAETVKMRLKEAENYKKATKSGEKTINLNEFLRDWSIENGILTVTYFQTDGGARIQDIIAGMTGLDVRSAVMHQPKIILRSVIQNGKALSLFHV